MQLDNVYEIRLANGGVRIVAWSSMRKGDSFFIPCLGESCKWDKEEILKKAKMAHVKVKIKLQTENTVQGLRVWRVD